MTQKQGDKAVAPRKSYKKPEPERFPYQGKMLTFRELSEATGLTVDALRYRVKVAGLTPEEALREDGNRFAEAAEMPPLELETFPYQGRSLTLKELAEEVGVRKETLYQRLKVLGWTMEEAVRTEKRPRANCRLMTAETPDGPVTKSMKAWAEERGISMSTISRRLGLGWNDTQALGFAPGPQAMKKRTKND